MSEAESENLGEEEFKIQQRWVISASNFSWVCNTKKDSAGRDYVRLTKFDRSLVRFALHKGMVHGQRSANVAIMDRLIQSRRAASVQAVQSQTEDNAKARKRKVRHEDGSLVDDFVTIDLEEVTDANGKKLGGYGTRALWGLDSSQLWLELTKANMEYMRAIIAKGQEEPGRTRQKCPQPKDETPKRPRRRKKRKTTSQSDGSPNKKSQKSPPQASAGTAPGE